MCNFFALLLRLTQLQAQLVRPSIVKRRRALVDTGRIETRTCGERECDADESQRVIAT